MDGVRADEIPVERVKRETLLPNSCFESSLSQKMVVRSVLSSVARNRRPVLQLFTLRLNAVSLIENDSTMVQVMIQRLMLINSTHAQKFCRVAGLDDTDTTKNWTLQACGWLSSLRLRLLRESGTDNGPTLTGVKRKE